MLLRTLRLQQQLTTGTVLRSVQFSRTGNTFVNQISNHSRYFSSEEQQVAAEEVEQGEDVDVNDIANTDASTVCVHLYYFLFFIPFILSLIHIYTDTHTLSLSLEFNLTCLILYTFIHLLLFFNRILLPRLMSMVLRRIMIILL